MSSQIDDGGELIFTPPLEFQYEWSKGYPRSVETSFQSLAENWLYQADDRDCIINREEIEGRIAMELLRHDQ